MNDFQKQRSTENWKRTMNDVPNGGYLVTMDSCGRSCIVCKSTNNLKRCGSCFRVFYCSKDCQRANWREHRDLCHQVTSQAQKGQKIGADREEGAEKPCKKCRTPSASLKTCGRCGEVYYCSKECQRDDWQQHKKYCKKTGKSKIESDWEAGKMFQDFARAIDPSQVLPVRRSTRPALTWDQALQAAHRLHPDKTVITKLKDVTSEEDLDPVMMTSTVFMACLSKPHPYVFRNAWYLEDCKGETVRIFFYLDNNMPEPYFKWSQLDCGNYLCLEHAYIHTFLDGTKGIRVDDACDISIIE